MSVHKNARTTPLGRAVMVRRIEVEGWTARAVADAFAVSERTVRKWLARYRAEGLAADQRQEMIPDGQRPIVTARDQCQPRLRHRGLIPVSEAVAEVDAVEPMARRGSGVDVLHHPRQAAPAIGGLLHPADQSMLTF